jgi:hypothetical protein
LLLFSVLYGFLVANYVAFNGDAMRTLATQFLALAEKQGASVPLMIGHRLMGTFLLFTGDIAESRAHYDRAIALYDPTEHRPLAMRFGQDVGVAILSFRSLALWVLGYPEAALTDTKQAITYAREIGHAATLMYALAIILLTHDFCGNYAVANAQIDELVALAEEKGALLEGARNDESRSRFGSDRQSLGRSPHDHLRAYRVPVNGSNGVDAVVLIVFGKSLCGTRSIR